MLPSVSLYAIIVLALSITVSFSTSEVTPKPCHGSHHCHRFGSTKNDVVRIWKLIGISNTMYCISSEKIEFIFGWNNSTQDPPRSIPQLNISSCDSTEYCLSLVVTETSMSWTDLPLYVNCKRISDTGSSRWYRVDNPIDPQDFHFEPTRRSDRNYTIVEPSSTTEPGTAEAKMSKITIAAVVGGAGVCILLLLFVVIILLKKVKRQRERIDMTADEIHEFMQGITAEKANAKGINGLFVLPYDKTLEILKSDVTFGSTILGLGAFGQVVKGGYRGSPVAIKMAKSSARSNVDYLRSLLGELKVMSYMGQHPNLVQLIGAITVNIKHGEVYIVTEYCANGNAQKFVRGRRDTFLNLVDAEATAKPMGVQGNARDRCSSRSSARTSHGSTLTTKDLVRWAYEVASGMAYVSSQKVYHGDLAARNILLTENLTAKVGDFGLAKQLDMETYSCYIQKKECPLPLKWMAIESLRDLTFSIQSDVWSFGVTMWELFTLGATPYPGLDWDFQSWKLLCEGRRLEIPQYATDSLYDIMMSCWDADPKARPAFAALRDRLLTELDKF